MGMNSPIPSDLRIQDLGNGNCYDDLAVDLMLLRIPRAETLERVGATLFPDADHIMLLTISLIIKLPEVVVQDHFTQMSNLPPFLVILIC